MDFEFDPRKSAANKQKHGIDFVAAQGLWLDEDAVEVTIPSIKEPRNAIIGKLGGKYWTAIITYRNLNIRLISVRRSRQKEVKFYEENNNR